MKTPNNKKSKPTKKAVVVKTEPPQRYDELARVLREQGEGAALRRLGTFDLPSYEWHKWFNCCHEHDSPVARMFLADFWDTEARDKGASLVHIGMWRSA